MADLLIFGTTNSDTISPTTSNHSIFAGGDNDLIDLSQSSGNNRVYGGGGNDRLIASFNDHLFGGNGDDQLFTGNGGNLLSGGNGNDQFWLAENGIIPEYHTTIPDFTSGIDKIIIDNVTGVSQLSDLTLIDQNGGTLIKIGEDNLAVLLGVNQDQLTDSNFVFKTPAIIANLASDTGVSNTDGITFNATITGSLIGTNLTSLQATLNDNNPVNVTLNEDGSFILTSEKLAELNGGTLADGQYNLKLIAVDNSGNNSEVTVEFTLDNTIPDLTTNLANDTGVSNEDKITSDPTITGSLIESNLDSFQATLNENNPVDVTLNGDGSFTLDSAKLMELNGGNLPDGDYILELSVTDKVGFNAGDTVEFTLDTTAPILTANLANDTGVSNEDKITNDATITGSLLESNVDSFQAKLNDHNPVDVTLNEDGSFTLDSAKLTEINDGILPDGSYTLQLIAVDKIDNNAEVTVSFTLDNTTPAITANLANDTGVSNEDQVTNDPTITGNLIESNLTSFKATLNTNNPVDISLNNDGSFSLTKEKLTEINGGTLPDGSYTLQLIAIDNSGNNSEVNVNFTLDTTAPTLTVTNPSFKLSTLTPDLSIENSPVDPTIVNLASKEWGLGNIEGQVTDTNLSSINYQLNNGNPLTITVNENGEFSQELALAGLANTYPNLTVTATDLAGNISTDNRILGVILTTETGLGYLDTTIGTGDSPDPNLTDKDDVTVHYTGTFTDGSVFDSSRDRGTPSTFSLNEVILGFKEGIDSMNVGGRRILFLPSNLGYNDGKVRIFDVELFGIS